MRVPRSKRVSQTKTKKLRSIQRRRMLCEALEARRLLAGDFQAAVDVPFGVFSEEEIEAFQSIPWSSDFSSKTPSLSLDQADGGHEADVLTIVLDFKEAGQPNTTDAAGNAVGVFDVTAFGFQQSDFDTVANAILAEVEEDFFDELAGTVAGPAGRDLAIDFIIGDIGTAPPGVSEYYFVQIGSFVSGPFGGALGVARGSGVRNAAGNGPNTIAVGDVFGSVFTNNIVGIGGLTPANALTSGNLAATTFGIGGTLSHEIGHGLSLSHISKAGSVQPTLGVSPIMGTGAIDLPNNDRIQDREFSLSGVDGQNGNAARVHIQQLVDAVGLHNKGPGSITGIHFEDVNGDGVFNGEDAGLAGVTMFADLNNDGSLTTGEPSDVTAADGSYTIGGLLDFTVPAVLAVPQTGFTQTTGSPGLTDIFGGIATTVADVGSRFDNGYDFGDADASYGTTFGNGAAIHRISANSLGALIDNEPDGQASPNADGDDLDGSDDEGGVTFGRIVSGTSAPMNVTTTGPGEVAVWIDFDQSGTFDNATERASFTVAAAGTHTLPVPIAASALPGNTTARFRFASNAAEIADPSGLATDGEVEDYSLVIESTISGFQPVAPLGSLIYDPPINGSITVAAEVDTFVIDVDPGQTITVAMTTDAGLQGSLELLDPTATLVASQTASAAGGDVFIQTIGTSAGGTFTLNVSGAAATTGNYTFEVILNAAVEEENLSGPTNDTTATAQDLDPAFITLPGGIAERTAVVGTAQSATSDVFQFTAQAGNASTLVVAGNVTLSLLDAGGNLVSIGQSASNADQIINQLIPTVATTYFAVIESATDGEDYSMIITRSSDFDTEPNDSIATAQDITVAVESIGFVADGGDRDFYSIQVIAGDALDLQTRTPADGPADPVNLLDPTLELFDPNGISVALDDNSVFDGRNAQIIHSAILSGTYTIAVGTAAGTSGEYLLDAFGQSGADPQPTVVSSNPADGATVTAFPSTYTVDFSEAIDLTTLDPTDILIGGFISTGFTIIDSDTIEFDIDPIANLGDGNYTVQINAGAVDDLQGSGNVLYSASFTFDSTVNVSGIKFEDINNNGIRDLGELGIGGVTFYIDANANGVLDVGERSEVTAADGTYTFANIIGTSNVTVREVVQAGFTQTTPAALPASEVLITELSQLVPDVLEIQNVAGADVNTSGWFLAASANGATINDADPNFFLLPATLPAGQVLSVSDEPTDTNFWGGNLNYAPGDDSWVLLIDSAGVVRDSLFIGYTAAEIATLNVTVNGVNVTANDVGWDRGGVTATTSVVNSIQRVGNSDGNALENFVSQVESRGTQNPGLIPPFNSVSAGLNSDIVPGITVLGDFGNVWDNGYDFGDADDTYGTTLTSNGAFHRVDPLIFLGASIDTETDAHAPGLAANGDDVADGTDDEDGVVFTSLIAPGTSATVDVTTSSAGEIAWWVDFDASGTFDPTERFSFTAPAAGTHNLTFTVPGVAVLGDTAARFRFATVAGDVASATGRATDGEVEDYAVTIQANNLDFGDAPTAIQAGGTFVGDYPTVLTDNGARHVAVGPTLGSGRDVEINGNPDANAAGDDNSAADDEDGVVFSGPIVTSLFSGGTATVEIDLQNADLVRNRLDAWIDWNRDGDWNDQDEQILISRELDVFNGTQTITFNVPQDTGTNVQPGQTYARFRVSVDGGLGVDGLAPDGEVEDHVVTIISTGADFGDAPTAIQAGGGTFVADYPVTFAQDGARHDAAGPRLGGSRDLEADGIADAGALGDDNDATDDEDGILLSTTLFASTLVQRTQNLLVDLQNPDPVSNFLSAWIDFNRDGDWDDPDEQILTDVDLGNVAGNQSVDYIVPQDSGANFEEGTSYARFRISTSTGLTPRGAANDGEVEDYSLELVSLVGDLGDAPTAAQAGGGTFVFDYPTTVADDGARHGVTPGPHFGSSVDFEKDGIPDAAALGDDNDSLDDENGVTIGSPQPSVFVSNTATVDVNASAAGFVSAWIDWNANGSWGEPGEQILTDAPVVAGLNTLSYTIPQDTGANVIAGTTFARFRISTATGLAPTGAALDGEVEDYQITVLETGGDFGDAPTAAQSGFANDYPVTFAQDGARHDNVGARLGAARDVEVDGTADTDALGDDNIGTDDEDGVVLTTAIATSLADGTGSIVVNLQNADPTSNLLDAWIDFNRDGDWDDPDEQIFLAEDLGTTDAMLSLTYTIPQDVGANVEEGTTFARFRLSQTGGLMPTGGAADGEVEDHAIEIVSLTGDFGDAPTAAQAGGGTFVADYPTTLANNGAVHAGIGATLGAARDVEGDATPNASATGDDLDNTDDEDGIFITGSLIATEFGTGSATINVDLQNADPGNNFLDAWVDWNRNGNWNDPNERILASFDLGTSNGIQSVTFPIPQDLGTNVIPGVSYARFRLSSVGGLNPDGIATDGEVEDYQVVIESLIGDFGDAPTAVQAGGGTFVSDYPTTLADNGAFHSGIGARLGAARDSESDGFASAGAVGDNSNGLPDEDGVTFGTFVVDTLNPTTASVTVDLQNADPGANFLSAWIDLNRDGDWDDADERVITDANLGNTDGLISVLASLPVDVGANVIEGTSFARFRLSTSAGLNPTGAAPNGEVEDYQVEIATRSYDFSDAPTAQQVGGLQTSNYPTRLVDNGAHHIATGPILGVLRDGETDGIPVVDALGDDASGINDEDGVTFAGALIASQTGPSIGSVDIELSNAGANNRLDAWVDWNRNGDWTDPGERIFSSFDLGTVNGTQSLTFVIPEDTGANVVEGISYARFRLSSSGGLAPNGIASDGEVEDYQILIDTDGTSTLNPLVRLEPLGSLIIGSLDNVGVLNNAGDTDQYQVFLEGGETISAQLFVDAGVQGTFEIVELGAIATSPGPGAPATLQPTMIPSDGIYTLQVTADAGTVFDLDLLQNAILESQVNDSGPGNVLPIDSSVIPLTNDLLLPIPSDRYAVFGSANIDIGGSLQVTRSNDPTQFIDIATSGTQLVLNDNESVDINTTVGNFLLPAGIVSVSNNGGVLSGSGRVLSPNNTLLPSAAFENALLPFWDDLDGPAPGGIFFEELPIGGHNALVVQWESRAHVTSTTGITFQLQLFETGPIVARYAYLDVEFNDAAIDNGASATIGFQLNSSNALTATGVGIGDVIDLLGGDEDLYQVDLTGRVGESIDVVLAGQVDDFSGQVLELLAPDGVTVLATGTATPNGQAVTNYDQAITDFIVPADGIYTVRVLTTTVSGDYAVVVGDSLSFDTEPNSGVVNLRDLTESNTGLGYLDANSADTTDNYQVTLTEGQLVTIGTETPFDDPAATPLNDLDLELIVRQRLGNQIIATAVNSNPDGKNAEVTFIAPADGVYDIELIANAGAGEYLLSVAIPVPTVSLNTDVSEINETGAGATFTAKLSHLFDRDVIVDLAFSGTATVGNDYFLSGTQIVIPAGQETGSVTIASRIDGILESNETVIGEIVAVQFGSELETQVATVTILDDEFLVPTISTSEPDPTNAAAIPIFVNFGGNVTGFDSSDILLSTGNVTNLIDLGNGLFIFDLVPTGDAVITVDIATGAARDAGNKQTLGAAQFSITSDRSGPVPVLTGPASPHNVAPFSINVSFNEPMFGLQVSDFVVSNGTVLNVQPVGGNNFVVLVGVAADGVVTVDLPAGSVNDFVGNPNVASNTFTVLIDTQSPIPVITGPTGPSNQEPFLINIDFGEEVNGFDATDLVVTNGSIISIADNGNGLFTARVDATNDGNVTIQVPPSSATDNGSNPNFASNLFSVIIDTTAPLLFGATDLIVEGDTTGGADRNGTQLQNLLTSVNAFDNIDLIVPVIHDAPALFPIGSTVVTFTGTDDAGNVGVLLITVTVSDTLPPIPTGPAAITVEGDTTGGVSSANPLVVAFLAGASATDIVDNNVTITNDAPAVLSLGDNVVTFAATDDSGNRSTVTGIVTVIDTTDPVLTPPADIVVEGDTAGGASRTGVNLTPFFSGVMGTDIVDDSLTITSDAPDVLPLGTTTVTFTATDDSGNSTSVTADVTVEDTSNPIIFPIDVTIEGDTTGGASATGTAASNFLNNVSTFDLVDADVDLSNDAPALLPLGDTVITFTAVDDEGNQSMATATITVVDTTNPTLTVPANTTVEGDTTGGADRDGANLNAYFAAAVGLDIVDAVVDVTSDAPAVLPLGATTLTFTATDDSGNMVSATSVITVIDTTPPVITLPADITVEGDVTGGADATGSSLAAYLAGATVVDIVDDTVTVSHDGPATFPVGDTVVTFTATDDEGNVSTATGTVTVTDTTDPNVVAPADITVEGDTVGGANAANTQITAFLSGATGSDIVDATPTITNDAPAIFSVGNTTVTFTATDDSGNSITATAIVTVVDTLDPVLAVPANLTVEGNTTGGATDINPLITTFLNSASATDIVDDTVTITNNAPALFPIGSTVVTFTATDDAGNSVTGSSLVTVQDGVAPTLTVPNAITVEGDSINGASVTGASIVSFLSGATAVDVVDASPTITNNAPPLFPLGTTIVLFTAVDDEGNSVTTPSSVTVIDTTPPDLSLPADITIEGDRVAGTDASNPAIVALLNGVSATDIVDTTPNIISDAPNLFPVGDTTITFAATDDSGNFSSGEVTVTVTDTVGPTITVPADITVEGDTTGGATPANLGIVAFLDGASAVDLIDPAPTLTNDAPAVFPVGDTVVTFTATDASGTATTATATVTVVDTTDPTLLAPGAISIEADTSGGLDATGTAIAALLGNATATDIVDPAPTVTNDAPAVLPVGDTVITFLAADATGNMTTATTTVTVTDSTGPTVTPPAAVTVEGDVTGGADATGATIAAFLTGATATDIVDTTLTITHDGPAVFPVGSTVVTFTATDDAGNASTATSTVTVTDTGLPDVTAPANLSLDGDVPGGVDATNAAIVSLLAGATATDVVDADVTITNDAPSVFPLGDTTVTFTGTDDSGNAATATTVVTVVDTVPPSVTAPADVTVEGDTTGGANPAGSQIVSLLSAATATDIVDTDVTITNDAPAVLPLGDTTITFTATDDAGNSATGTTTVTVTDTTSPTITPPADISVDANLTGGADATLAEIQTFLAGATAADVVDAAPTVNTDAPSVFPVGDTSVTFTVTDASGNQQTATATVSVVAQPFTSTVAVSPTGPAGATDPADLPRGPQPTSWAAQRSGVREIVLTFELPIQSPTASDIVLTNLGVDAPVDADQVIALRDDQLTLSADGLELRISLDADQLTDGVYELELLPSITFGESFVFGGQSSDGFHVLAGDWDGSGGVNILDFATFAYWFNTVTPVSPEYVDLDGSGGVNILDLAQFVENFGKTLVFESGPADSTSAAEGELLSSVRTLVNPPDVNGDGNVTAGDALNVINELGRGGGDREFAWSRFDVTRNGSISALDALVVINRLSEQSALEGLSPPIESDSGNNSDDDETPTEGTVDGSTDSPIVGVGDPNAVDAIFTEVEAAEVARRISKEAMSLDDVIDLLSDFS